MKWNKDIARPNNPTRKEVEESVDHLERSGVVMQYNEGGIFLNLDDDWINKPVNAISGYGYEVPPFFQKSDGEGAHIKIAEKDEIKAEIVQEELGRKVHFEVVRAYASFPNLKTYGLENIMKINVQSAELDNIRKRLTGKITPPNGKFFYIVVAVRKIMPLRSLGMRSGHEVTQSGRKNDDDKDKTEHEEEHIMKSGKEEVDEEMSTEDDEDEWEMNSYIN